MLIIVNEANEFVVADSLDELRYSGENYIVYGEKSNRRVHFAKLDEEDRAIDISYETYLEAFDAVHDWADKPELKETREILMKLGFIAEKRKEAEAEAIKIGLRPEAVYKGIDLNDKDLFIDDDED